MTLLAIVCCILLWTSIVESDSPNRFQTAARCGERYLRIPDGREGTLVSPGYGESGYQNFEGCTWVLEGPRGKKMSIVFEALDLEHHSHCDYDFVSVTDAVGNPIATFCGDQCLPSTIVQTHVAQVHFNADRNLTRRGFQLRYQAVPRGGQQVFCRCNEGQGCLSSDAVHDDNIYGTCGGEYYGPGILASPGYPGSYSNYEYCVWTIAVPEQAIVLEFSEFQLEYSSGCYYDSLTVSEGIDYEVQRHVLCGSLYDIPNPISLRASEATLRFTTDSSVTRSGFVIHFYGGVPEPTEPPVTFPPYTGSCGSRPEAIIVGGDEATPFSWPWMILLNEYDYHVCGGSLVAPNWVITAAHCVSGVSASSLNVVAGVHDMGASEPSQQSRQVTSVYTHSSYGYNGEQHDIALLYVDNAFQFNSAVSPVCLSRVHPPSGTGAYITGWGNTESPVGYPEELYEAYVPFIDTSVCNRAESYDGQITEGMFCAGYLSGGVDTCQGDSGGPLVSNYTGTWVLYGITSWGYGCADTNHPGVYTQVTYYADWLEMTSSGAIEVN